MIKLLLKHRGQVTPKLLNEFALNLDEYDFERDVDEEEADEQPEERGSADSGINLLRVPLIMTDENEVHKDELLEDVISELNDFVLDGKAGEAVELAIKKKQWAHATIIARTLFNSVDPILRLARTLKGIVYPFITF